MKNKLKDVLDLVKNHIEKVQISEEGEKLLKQFNQTIQFRLKEGGNLYITIQDGKVSIRTGDDEGLNFADSLLVETDMTTIEELFNNRLSIADSMFKMQTWIYGIGTPKGSMIPWLSEIIRFK